MNFCIGGYALAVVIAVAMCIYVAVCGLVGLYKWIFENGLKQGLLRLAGTGLGLLVLWSIGALISGI